jgi:hypothetical protein
MVYILDLKVWFSYLFVCLTLWWNLGVYDALQKKYLKTLLFCICEKEEGPMIEEYTCEYHLWSLADL